MLNILQVPVEQFPSDQDGEGLRRIFLLFQAGLQVIIVVCLRCISNLNV